MKRLRLLHLHNFPFVQMSTPISIGQRFTQLIQHLGLSKNAFAQSLDKTATVIQHLVDERNKPGYDLLCKVFETYPNVSKDWLLLGQGSMMISPASPPATASGPPLPAPTVEKTPTAAPVPVEATLAPVAPIVPTPTPAPIPAALASEELAPLTPAPLPTPVAPLPDANYLTVVLQTQQLQHQLALAEQRNQHLLEQQQLMQQMVALLQRAV